MAVAKGAVEEARARDGGRLVRVAAQRITQTAPAHGSRRYLQEFCARFPYDETPDQAGAIEATLDDLAARRPMDRLVCGNVGFGRTQVALPPPSPPRSMADRQPSSLRRRCSRASTHRTFASASPACPSALANSRGWSARRKARGQERPCRGRHRHCRWHPCRLGQDREFKDLGLVVVDEEQHFGVGHKERLKELRSEVHVLTLSATPIPRTLQLR